MKPEISIIIINYNTPQLTLDCLLTIKKFVKVPVEVIVVDNGSKEELRIKNNELKKANLTACNLQLITLESNRGFGAGNNAGAKKAVGKYLWFLNSDTLLVEDTAKKLSSFLEHHKEIGAASPILYHNDGTIQKNFFARFQTLGNITFQRYNYQKIDLSKEFFYTDIVVGAAMMMRKDLFEKINGFDEHIFMYLEDDDICKRIKNLGYKNAVLNTAGVIHLGGGSTKKNKERKKLYYTSQTYFWRKHNGTIATLIMRILRWPYKLLKMIQISLL